MIINWAISTLFHTYWLVSLLLLLPLQFILRTTIDPKLDCNILPDLSNFKSFHCSYDKNISFSKAWNACGTGTAHLFPHSNLWLSFSAPPILALFQFLECARLFPTFAQDVVPALNSLPPTDGCLQASTEVSHPQGGHAHHLSPCSSPSPFFLGLHSHSWPPHGSGHRADVCAHLWWPVFPTRLYL